MKVLRAWPLRCWGRFGLAAGRTGLSRTCEGCPEKLGCSQITFIREGLGAHPDSYLAAMVIARNMNEGVVERTRAAIAAASS